MKTIFFTVTALMLFIASILLRPTLTDLNQSVAAYKEAETLCNWLMTLSFLSMCTAFITKGRSLRRSNPQILDREFNHLIK